MPTADQVKREFSKAQLLSLAGDEGLEVQGGRLQCPLRCDDDKRGASVDDAHGYALWHCHRCDAGGSAIDLVMSTRNLDEASALALLLEQRPALATPGPRPKRAAPDAAELWRALAAADDQGMAYLRGRGLEAAVPLGAVRFNAGGCGFQWLDHKAVDGYRVAMPLYASEGQLATLQLRSVQPAARVAKISLPGSYPPGGVAFGAVGRARQAQRIFLAEGMADTLALLVAGVDVVGAPGVDQVKKLHGFLGDVVDRVVILCPQNDVARVVAGAKPRLTSEQAFADLAQQLSAAGAQVLRLRTPAPHKDPADWLRAAGLEAFKAALAELQLEQEEMTTPATSGSSALKVVPLPLQKDPRPRIIIRTDEHLVAEEAVSALRNDDRVYQRDGMLVHVQRDAARSSELKRAANAPRIAPLPPAVLRETLAAQARWMKVLKTRGKMVPDHPPAWAVAAIHARGTWEGIRYLSGLVEVPVLRPDGSVLEEAGYDEATGLLYEPNTPVEPLPAAPTRADAFAALDLLLEAVADFPFAGPAHKSAWLAALLTPLARYSFQGPAPLFLIDANTRGSGKSKLADLVSVIVAGRDMARMPPEDKDEEWRKRILSVALAGDPMVLIDNVVGSLGARSLDAALTGTSFFDRVLGSNTMSRVALWAVWFASGNNVLLRGDLVRRTVHVRLESPVEKPEERTEFLHPRLLSWALDQRPALLRAALTVLKAWRLAETNGAGAAVARMPQWGSYEEWSRAVRAPLVWLGLEDPASTRAQLHEAADSDAQLLSALLSAWEELFGGQAVTIAEVLKHFTKEEELARVQKQATAHPRLYDVLAELAPPVGGHFNARAIGNRLKAFRGRVVEGKSFEMRFDRTRTAMWSIRGAGAAGSAGSLLGHASEEYVVNGGVPQLRLPVDSK